MIECSFEDKGKGFLRHVTIGVIIVNDKKEVLLVRRAPNIHNGDKYTIPGGFLDRNETAQKGALREMVEETGYRGEIINLFRINDTNRPKEDRQNVDFIFIAKITSGHPQDNKEVTNIKWFSEENLPQDEEFAFFHRKSILRYFEYLRIPFPLPILS